MDGRISACQLDQLTKAFESLSALVLARGGGARGGEGGTAEGANGGGAPSDAGADGAD